MTKPFESTCSRSQYIWSVLPKMSSQPPKKRPRQSFHTRNGATTERLDPYEPGIVNSCSIGMVNHARQAGNSGSAARSPQKGRTTYNPPPSWPSELHLLEDAELGLGDGFGDDEWEGSGNEEVAKKQEASSDSKPMKSKRVSNACFLF